MTHVAHPHSDFAIASRPSNVPAFDFDPQRTVDAKSMSSKQFTPSMAQAMRQKSEKAIHTFDGPRKMDTDSTLCCHNSYHSADEDYSDDECETDISAKETPRVSLRLLNASKLMEMQAGTQTEKLQQKPSNASHTSSLEDIDEEQELQMLKEQQEMIEKEQSIRRQYADRVEEERRLEQQMYIMRMEQLEMIKLQQALAKESGRPDVRNRPTTAPAKRPAKYFGERNDDIFEKYEVPQQANVASSAKPSTERAAEGPKKSVRPKSAMPRSSSTWNPFGKNRASNAVLPDEASEPLWIDQLQIDDEPPSPGPPEARHNTWL
mmetsp:Transcript_37300/g.76465  ORF Transcript_37300/g.76465 Transcript_37300/m.76465 type:complete len:320 (-) Transcript_37300:524-1483(-)|eukprot:CAMPEP_0181315986 /NCGR_PEP_ID=MMETSP1101-20121128/15658_1 /TAXON_ID=46948 /ORGANISM="Rhodomonas abbreviata, Strain Caron Lab Isolate" /LENGTH=319 /DNA_ID=CAMNT_0023423211 /DNA_START=127 /DNA_END=1086 /DNA_ORIENTATION=-